jgi:hypothetical protein
MQDNATAPQSGTAGTFAAATKHRNTTSATTSADCTARVLNVIY